MTIAFGPTHEIQCMYNLLLEIQSIPKIQSRLGILYAWLWRQSGIYFDRHLVSTITYRYAYIIFNLFPGAVYLHVLARVNSLIHFGFSRPTPVTTGAQNCRCIVASVTSWVCTTSCWKSINTKASSFHRRPKKASWVCVQSYML